MTTKEKAMMPSRIWVLGAADPEMERIEQLLADAGEDVTYAVVGGEPGGERVKPGTAYGGRPWRRIDPATPVITVECSVDPWSVRPGQIAHACDHHRPGDPGYGRPPADFWAASSIGQVCAILGHAPTRELLLIAASDHCPSAAYAGLCPGIDPDELLRWRAASRAAFRGITAEQMEATVLAAVAVLRAAPMIRLDGQAGPGTIADVRDLHVPELPEASLRLGVPILCRGLPDRGRRKINVLGDVGGHHVRAFLGGWAARNGLVDMYGDPMRGYAGGYDPTTTPQKS